MFKARTVEELEILLRNYYKPTWMEYISSVRCFSLEMSWGAVKVFAEYDEKTEEYYVEVDADMPEAA